MRHHDEVERSGGKRVASSTRAVIPATCRAEATSLDGR